MRYIWIKRLSPQKYRLIQVPILKEQVVPVTFSRESTNHISVRFCLSQRLPTSVTFTRDATIRFR
jgi:hypothetical protein